MTRGHATILAVSAIVAAVCGRVIYCGWEEYELGEGFAAAGLEEPAVRAFGRASRWYLPGFGAQDRAMTRLLELARRQESEGRTRDALRTFEEIRSSAWSTRWLLTTHDEILEEANAGISRIRGVTMTESARKTLANRLRADETPNAWLSLVAVLLFLTWVAATTAGAWWCASPRLDDQATAPSEQGFWRRPKIPVRILLSFLLSTGLAAGMLLALRFA